MDSERLTNPLSVDDLLEVREIYRDIRASRPVFLKLPLNSTWIRWRYLDETVTTTLASVHFGDSPTLSIHPEAFKVPDRLLLRGLVHHEMLHLALGQAEGHGPMFRNFEQSWEHYQQYRGLKARFHRGIQHFGIGTAAFAYRCPNCGDTVTRSAPLSPDSACRLCCKAFNDGKWCETYALIRVGYGESVHDEAEEDGQARIEEGHEGENLVAV